MLRRFFASCLVLFLFLTTLFPNDADAVSAKSAVLINATTGEIIYEKDAFKKLPMASTTKIMTALLLAEQPDLTKTLVTTKQMVTVEGSSMGLLEGDTVSYYALLVGMLLASGNDAANTTAITLAGSTDAFVERMNTKARQIGMKNTNFVTPSGLDDEYHYSTAYDMAILGAYAMQNPVFAKVCSAKSLTVEYGNPPYRRTLSNHNRLLSLYDNTVGIKTGFTKKSGRCLVSAADNENGRVIAVTLNAPDDWNDHIKLLEMGLASINKVTFNTNETLYMNVVGGTQQRVELYSDPAVISLTKNSQTKITQKILIPSFRYAPIKTGDELGRIEYYYEGKKISEAPLKAKGEVEKQPSKKADYLLFLLILDIITAIGV